MNYHLRYEMNSIIQSMFSDGFSVGDVNILCLRKLIGNNKKIEVNINFHKERLSGVPIRFEYSGQELQPVNWLLYLKVKFTFYFCGVINDYPLVIAITIISVSSDQQLSTICDEPNSLCNLSQKNVHQYER